MPVCVCLTVFNVLVEQEPNRWQSTERRKMDRVQAAAIILMLGTHVWSIVSYDTPLFSAQTISLSPFYSSLVYSWKNASWHYFCIYTSIRFLFNRCCDCFTAASQREHSGNSADLSESCSFFSGCLRWPPFLLIFLSLGYFKNNT